MRPLALSERGIATPTVSLADLLRGAQPALTGACTARLEDYVEEIVSSGFPGLRGSSGRALRGHLDGYLRHIVDRDFEELGHNVRDPVGVRRRMTAYAAATSTTASFETIRDAATGGHGEKPAKTTTLRYRDVLERLWVLDPLDAWLPTRNRISRLSSQAPACRPRVGRPAAGHRRRSVVGRSGDRSPDKLARDVSDSDATHLRWLANRIGDELLDALIVTTGTEAYRRPDGIGVVPAPLLGP